MGRLIIDVREPDEFAKGHVDGAINIPPARLMSDPAALGNTPKDAEIILYCVSGSRSNTSKKLLESRGYTNVINGINQDHVNQNYKL